MYLLNWFRKPYFFNHSIKSNLIISFGGGLFVFLFLFFFRPFGLGRLNINIFYYTAGFGLITLAAMFIFYIIFPYLFKNLFKNENWTVGKNTLLLFLLIFSISISNWYFNSLIQDATLIKLPSLSKSLLDTFSLAIFPSLLLSYISERLYTKKRLKTSKEIMSFRTVTKVEKKNEEIIMLGENKKESINFNIDNLVYINSQGNYTSFYILSDKIIKEKILRNTLSNIALDLNQYSNIIRCHKSYIVNSKYMDAISGNARGHFLESELISIKIPVSRSFKKEKLKNLIS